MTEPPLQNNPEGSTHYATLLGHYPQIGQILQEAALLGMYTGSVVCALSSAEHYGAVDKAFIATVTRVLVAFGMVVPFVALARLDDGLAWSHLVSNAVEAIRSFY